MIRKIIFVFLFLYGGILAAQEKADSIINTGYNVQTLESVSGAVTKAKGTELQKSPVGTLNETFAGRLYGRGLCSINGSSPLVVVDGMITPDPIWNYITPEEIESVLLLKDASTTSLYGIQGANGILVINTRRGHEGKVKVNLSFDHAFQQMTHKPNMISSSEYAILRNQAAFNDDNSNGMFSQFTQEEIDSYASGSDPERYPNNNFYSMMFRDLTSFQRLNLSVSGGNKNIRMYSNINVLNQNPFFNQGQTKYKDQVEYDVGLYTRWINYRTNLDIIFNKYLSGFLRLNGNLTFSKQPGYEYYTNSQGVDSYVSNTYSDIYSSLFSLAPTTPGPLTPDGEVVTSPLSTSYPAYGRINRTGYNSLTAINNLAQTGLNLDLGFITKGLNLSGSFAYNFTSQGTLLGKKTYERWQVQESIIDSVVFVKYGSWNNKPLTYSKVAGSASYIASNIFLKYDREFGIQTINTLAYANFQKLDYNLFPSYRVNYGLSAQYGIRAKYFIKADLAYSGSEQFAPENRYTFVPSVAASWIVSKESFLSGILWLDYLKLRASYGKSGNDRGLSQYLYADKYIIGGGYIADLAYGVNEEQIGNPGLTPELLKSFNIGADFNVMKHLSVSLDFFRQNMDNMLINSYGIVPWYIGYSSNTFPKSNKGKVKNHGLDANITYQTSLNSKIDLFSNLIVTYNKNEVIESGQVDNPDDYYRKNYQNGYPIGQDIGYIVDFSGPGNGFYTSEDDILSSGLDFQIGKPRPGDLKFKDLNGDGIINEKDRDVIGNGSVPLVNFGLSLGMNLNSQAGKFDFSCLLQGIAGYKVYINLDESTYEGVFSDIHMNAWTQEKYDAGQRDFDSPALSLKTSYSQNHNNFFMMNGSYLRLKNLVIGYSFPESITNRLHLNILRIYFSGQNLFTLDGLNTRNVDPETQNLYTFQVFRIMNIGVNISF
ncbi:MAG: SusC/RagA family TonB-linked outer membrane protein [Bacteroidales bacterium]